VTAGVTKRDYRVYGGPTVGSQTRCRIAWNRGTGSALVGRMTSRLVLALTFFAAAPALAQPAPKAPPRPAPPVADDMAAFEKDLDALFVHGGLTADTAASRAGAVSPAVHRKLAELQAAAASTYSVELTRLPIVGGKASYTRLSYLAPLNLGGFMVPFLQNSTVLEGSIAVPLSDYLRRIPAAIDAAQLAEQAARDSWRSVGLNAAADARVSFYEWVRARLQVLVAQRQLAQVQATLGQVRALAEVQRLSRADLLRVESQAAEAEHTLDQLKQLEVLREEQLRLVIGAPGEEPLAIGEDIRADLHAPPPAGLDELMKRAEQRRLEFRTIDAGIAAKEQQRKSEQSNQYPHLSAFGAVDYADPNPRVFPQADVFKFTWQAGIQISWTLNDTLQSRTTEHRLRAETDELRADRDSLYRGTRVEVLAAEQAVQLAVHALDTSQKGLVAAEEGYRVRKELLNAERATAVELVDSETDLTRARITALNARVDLRVAMSQLAHAIGDDAAPAK
jgi:outer membrane protein